ncbi:helicase associated domain-containing protein [Streptomyces sp. NPDC087425]|uniref:helicase associated domain-containing protein n=1 Tax=Streptomyces sp. NPDC087425 TaxID=3365787 RepID=UPI00381E71A1
MASAYGLQATDLAAWWQWTSPVHQGRGARPDGEVFLDAVAQGQLAGWCRVPTGHLARALPSWTAGPTELAGRADGGRGWARWRAGASQWGQVVFGCRLCAARRGGGGEPVWSYRPPWRRLCARHGRWLLEVGEGHPVEFVDAGDLVRELIRAQRRWGRVERSGQAFGAAPCEVFGFARAVVCGWWGREEFWEREAVWGPRLEQVVAATRQWCPDLASWGVAQWRLLVRDVVVFPVVVAVAEALVNPRMRQLAAGDGSGALVRVRGGGEWCAAAVGRHLGREWLVELETDGRGGPLASWASAAVNEQRRPAGSPPRQGRHGLWWVHSAHRPVEVGTGLRRLAEPLSAGSGVRGGPSSAGDGGPAVQGGWRVELAVPRRAGHGRGLERQYAQRFTEGLVQARLHVERFGHLAVAHTDGRVQDGFDLGRWLANRRADAASLTMEQAEQLRQLDVWWNPPWPISWQRAWYRARAHVEEEGPVHGGDNLAGLPRWLQRWLRHQISGYGQLHDGQRVLLAELGLIAVEVERFYAWPGRRRPATDGLAVACAYAARHGHLAVSRPTAVDGFALGAWLSNQRQRQRGRGWLTRLGHRLTALDAWWNPPWPVAWQRMWWACRYHLAGLPRDLQWWPDAPDSAHAASWLCRQTARRPLLQPGQQRLVDELLSPAGSVPAWQPQTSDDA